MSPRRARRGPGRRAHRRRCPAGRGRVRVRRDPRGEDQGDDGENRGEGRRPPRRRTRAARPSVSGRAGRSHRPPQPRRRPRGRAHPAGRPGDVESVAGMITAAPRPIPARIAIRAPGLSANQPLAAETRRSEAGQQHAAAAEGGRRAPRRGATGRRRRPRRHRPSTPARSGSRADLAAMSGRATLSEETALTTVPGPHTSLPGSAAARASKTPIACLRSSLAPLAWRGGSLQLVNYRITEFNAWGNQRSRRPTRWCWRGCGAIVAGQLLGRAARRSAGARLCNGPSPGRPSAC